MINPLLPNWASVAFLRLRLFHAFVFFLLFAAGAASVESQTLPPDSPSGFIPGIISIIAGGGTLSTSPTGTPATSTSLGILAAVAVDSQQNVYIGLPSGEGILVVYGGLGIPPILSEVAAQPTPGNVYLVTNPDPSVSCTPPLTQCGDGGPASQASFNYITSLFIDPSDNVYVIDGGASAIREITQNKQNNTTNVTTVVGQINNPGAPSPNSTPGSATGATLSYPYDAKLDTAGNIYITDDGNGILAVVYLNDPVPPILVQEQISPLTKGNIYTVAGMLGQFCGGPGTCGDAGSAANATFANPLSVDIDTSGNIYVADYGSSFTTPIIGGTIRLIYAGNNSPPLLKTVTSQPTAGTIYAVVGTESTVCIAAPCGDGGPALQAQLNGPSYVKVDSIGDIYIADQFDNTIRKVDIAGYISDIAGTETPGVPATSPTGTGGSATSAGFSGPLNFAFDSQNNLYITDGTPDDVVWEAAPALPQTITFNPPEPVTYGTPPVPLTATASSGLPVSYSVTGPGTLSGSDLAITASGTVEITASQPGNAQYSAAASVTQSLTVNKALLSVIADNTSRIYNTPNPTFTASYSGFVNGDTPQTVLTGQPALSSPATTSSSTGTYPIIVSQGTLASPNYAFAFVNGTLTITGSNPQTISFAPLPPVTYGQASTIALAATATSKLPVQFTVIAGPGTISGSTLTITGGGTIQIAANQSGSNTYAAAPQVTQTLLVNPAPLTVTGPTVSLPYGTTVNPAQFPPPAITGFVGSDTSAIVTGSPQYSTTASGTPQGGSYPIQVTQGTLALEPGYTSNYAFAHFIPGTLTITTASQSINFTPVPAVTTYGVGTVTLTATASSGLPIAFTLTGPATFVNGVNTTNPSAGLNNVALYITGAGVVTVTTTQIGNVDYLAASPVIQTFTVNQAVLGITANNVTRTYNVPNPTFTYQISGFVNGDGDIPSVVTGVPVLSTTVTQTSPPGTYPITVAQGTLSAPNYTFNLVNGTLTVLPPGNYTIAANPTSLTIAQGHNGQATMIITPNNDYQGTITLSCGALPANVSCVFSPTTYTFSASANNATENPLQGTLTINTIGGQPVVGTLLEPAVPPGPPVLAFLFPTGIAAVLLTARRRSFKASLALRLSAVFLMLLLVTSVMSCGSSSGPALAAPGSTTIMINGIDAQNVSASVPLTVVIQ